MGLNIFGLEFFFEKITSFDKNMVLYVSDVPLKLKDIILIHDPDDIDNVDDDVPRPARERNLKESISVIDCLSIINNINNQGVKNIDVNIFLESLNYYLLNDAFIDLNRTNHE